MQETIDELRQHIGDAFVTCIAKRYVIALLGGLALVGCTSKPVMDYASYKSATELALDTLARDYAAQGNPQGQFDTDTKNGINRGANSYRIQFPKLTLHSPKLYENLGGYCRNAGGDFSTNDNGALLKDKDTITQESYQCTRDSRTLFSVKKTRISPVKTFGTANYRFEMEESLAPDSTKIATQSTERNSRASSASNESKLVTDIKASMANHPEATWDITWDTSLRSIGSDYGKAKGTVIKTGDKTTARAIYDFAQEVCTKYGGSIAQTQGTKGFLLACKNSPSAEFNVFVTEHSDSRSSIDILFGPNSKPAKYSSPLSQGKPNYVKVWSYYGEAYIDVASAQQLGNDHVRVFTLDNNPHYFKVVELRDGTSAIFDENISPPGESLGNGLKLLSTFNSRSILSETLLDCANNAIATGRQVYFDGPMGTGKVVREENRSLPSSPRTRPDATMPAHRHIASTCDAYRKFSAARS